eukprot:2833640-Alexandrium_andersonii.AAC.1
MSSVARRTAGADVSADEPSRHTHAHSLSLSSWDAGRKRCRPVDYRAALQRTRGRLLNRPRL